MSCTINFRTKVKTSTFLNFFIVPPPPITGRDEPNITLATLLCPHYIIFLQIVDDI